MTPEYWMGQGFGFMWIFPLLFLAVFIFFMRGMFGQNNNSNKTIETPREILDKRFAKGEINKDEYEEMKKTLNN